MTKKEEEYAVRERAKWVYFTVLHSIGETIMPFWQMFFYYLIYSTKARNGFSGFEKGVNGFPLINPRSLLKTSIIMVSFDIMDLVLFTYIVRQKFSTFTPFRILNMLIKKYKTLIGLSTMSAVISVQCVLIIDCGFDFSKEAFGF